MSAVTKVPNHAKYMLATKKIDLANDVIKAVLLDPAFVFYKNLHGTLADITANQLATGYGYTQNSDTIANQAVAEDNVVDAAVLTADTVTWHAVGGIIGPFRSVAFYDDTTDDDTVLCCVDLGEDVSIVDGSDFSVTNVSLKLL